MHTHDSECIYRLNHFLFHSLSFFLSHTQTFLATVPPPPSPLQPKLLLSNCSLPLTQWLLWKEKFQTGPLTALPWRRETNLLSSFGKIATLGLLFLRPRRARPVWSLLGKSLVELTHHISQARARTHCNSQGPIFLRSCSSRSPLCLSCWPGCFQTQWTHLSGQAQCERSSPKALSVSVKDKKNEKTGERKNDHCLSGPEEC